MSLFQPSHLSGSEFDVSDSAKSVDSRTAINTNSAGGSNSVHRNEAECAHKIDGALGRSGGLDSSSTVAVNSDVGEDDQHIDLKDPETRALAGLMETVTGEMVLALESLLTSADFPSIGFGDFEALIESFEHNNALILKHVLKIANTRGSNRQVTIVDPSIFETDLEMFVEFLRTNPGNIIGALAQVVSEQDLVD